VVCNCGLAEIAQGDHDRFVGRQEAHTHREERGILFPPVVRSGRKRKRERKSRAKSAFLSKIGRVPAGNRVAVAVLSFFQRQQVAGDILATFHFNGEL